MTKLAVLASLGLSLGCVIAPGDDSPGRYGGGGAGGGAGSTSGSAGLVGDYAGYQIWDLGSVTEPDNVASAVSNAAVGTIVDLSGVPSFLEDDAESVIRGLVGDDLSAAVETAVAETELFDDLGDVLGSVRVGTDLHIESVDATGKVVATEELTSIAAGDIDVPVSAVLYVTGFDEVIADIEGQVDSTGRVITFDPHAYQLRVDVILSLGGVPVLDYSDLESALDSILDCEWFIGEITGGTGTLHFTVSGYEVDLGGAALDSVCSTARGELTERILDYFRTDVGITAGGTLAVASGSLTSDTYSAELTLLPVHPTFDVDYDVNRLDGSAIGP